MVKNLTSITGFKNSIFRLSLLFFIFSTFLFSCTAIKSDENILTGKLPNGLTYIIKQNAKPSKQASLRLAVKSGSVEEADDQKGIAHLVEHMAFNGTQHFPKNKLVDFLEIMGIEFGPELNAYTSYDHTVYKLEVPISEEKNIDTALLVLSDWAGGLLLNGEEIDKERGVVLQEWRDGLGASSRLRDQYLPLIFKDSIYGMRQPIGDPEIVKTISHKRVQDFYSDWYQPNRMAVIAVGDFNPIQMKEKIIGQFSWLKNNNKSEPDTSIPDSQGTDYAILTDPEADSSSIWIINRLKSKQISPYKAFKQTILLNLADKIISNRLEEKLNSGSAGIISAYSNLLDLAIEKKFYMTGIDFNATEYPSASQAYFETVETLRQAGCSVNELNQAVAEILAQLETATKEQLKQDSSRNASLYVSRFINSDPIIDPDWAFSKATSLCKRIGTKEINKILLEILRPSDRSCIILAPKSEEENLPIAKTLEKTIQTIQEEVSSKIPKLKQALENQAKDSSLQVSLGKPGTIVSKEKLELIGAEKWILSNGVVVYIKKTSFTSNRFQYLGISPGGTSLASDTLFPSAEMADDLISESGIANLDKNEKRQWMKKTLTSASINIDELEQSISGVGDRAKAEEVFKLIYAHFTAIEKSSKAFEKVKSDLINVARNRDKNPKNYFDREVTQILRKKGERNPELSLNAAKKASFIPCFNFAQQRFSDASDFTFFISGALDMATLEPLVIKYLSSLPSDNNRDNKEVFKRRYSKYPKNSKSYTIKKGQEKQALIYTLYSREKKWDRVFNRRLNAAMDCLDRMLSKEIREKESGTYSIGAFAYGRDKPYQELIGGVIFSCKPSRMDELIKKEQRIIDQFLDGKFDPQLLKNYKKITLTNIAENKEKDIYWIHIMQMIENQQLTQKAFVNIESEINELTPELIREAAWQLFYNQPKTEIILLPKMNTHL